MNECISCGKNDFIRIPTYKRDWYLCRGCGTAIPNERDKFPLRFLPYKDMKKQSALDAQKMYDYFVDPIHIEISEREGNEFIDKYITPNNIDVSGKSILDISGGNGHFVSQIQKLGAEITLTEYNKKTVEYAKKTHSFTNVYEYDLNNDDLFELTGQQFDIVLARACIMFCDDLKNLVSQIKKCLKPGGIVILNHSVEPTLGVLTRVQLDEFSYSALRQPETVVDTFEAQDISIIYRLDETDPSLYVYDHDLLRHWMIVHYLYEIRGARVLAKERLYSFPARDRRRSTFIFKNAV